MKTTKGTSVRMMTFTYKGKTYTKTLQETGKFFNAGYSVIHVNLVKRGMTDQEAADAAMVLGKDYPTCKAALDLFIYKGRR